MLIQMQYPPFTSPHFPSLAINSPHFPSPPPYLNILLPSRHSLFDLFHYHISSFPSLFTFPLVPLNSSPLPVSSVSPTLINSLAVSSYSFLTHFSFTFPLTCRVLPLPFFIYPSLPSPLFPHIPSHAAIRQFHYYTFHLFHIASFSPHILLTSPHPILTS